MRPAPPDTERGGLIDHSVLNHGPLEQRRTCAQNAIITLAMRRTDRHGRARTEPPNLLAPMRRVSHRGRTAGVLMTEASPDLR